MDKGEVSKFRFKLEQEVAPQSDNGHNIQTRITLRSARDCSQAQSLQVKLVGAIKYAVMYFSLTAWSRICELTMRVSDQGSVLEGDLDDFIPSYCICQLP